jgi:hypothetical protein
MRKHLLFSTLLASFSIYTLLLHAQSQNTISNNHVTNISLLGITSNLHHQRMCFNATKSQLETDSVTPGKKMHELHVTGNAQISGNVGIGTSSSPYRLNVFNKETAIYAISTNGHGVYGFSTANGFAGIYGTNTNNSGFGVWGMSPNIGVFGNGSTGVYGSGSNYGLRGNSDHIGVYGTGAYGVFGIANSDTGTGVWGSGGMNGVYGTSVNNASYGIYGSSPNIGIFGLSSSDTGTGIWGNSTYIGINGTGFYGVSGTGTIGVNGFSSEDFGAGMIGNATGFLADGGSFASSQGDGIEAVTYSPTTSYAGFFDGDVYTTGLYFSSDKRLKQNIADVSNALEIINKLQPKYYEYRQDGNYKLMNLPQGKHYGLVAQDVEQVLPSLIKETKFVPHSAQTLKVHNAVNSKPTSTANQDSIIASEKINFKALNYTELIPIMIKAIQELNKKDNEIDDLKQKNKDLEDRLEKLEAIVLNKYNASADLSSASLEQNTPNPFNSATVIRYHLPQSAGSAKVVITDMSGRTIKSISLNSRGNGQLTLSSGTLAAGSYNYTLWMDGKQVDSKKMVITK